MWNAQNCVTYPASGAISLTSKYVLEMKDLIRSLWRTEVIA
jgi:hypothetical protein